MYFNKYDMYSIVGIDKKTHGEGIGIFLHTYVRTQYKPKILHTKDPSVSSNDPDAIASGTAIPRTQYKLKILHT